MGLFSSDKDRGWGGKATSAQRAAAKRAQERDERFERQMKERQRLERDRARGRSKGWW